MGMELLQHARRLLIYRLLKEGGKLWLKSVQTPQLSSRVNPKQGWAGIACGISVVLVRVPVTEKCRPFRTFDDVPQAALKPDFSLKS